MHIRSLASLLILAFSCALHAGAQDISDADLATFDRVNAVIKSLTPAEKKKLAVQRQKVKADLEKKDREEALAGSVPQEGFERAKELSHFRLRRSYADLLSTESGAGVAAIGEGQKAALKDNKGATFAYTNDLQKSSESWATEGAVLYPVVFKGAHRLRTWGFMPSITLNRFSTNEEAKDAEGLKKIKAAEVDELTYRLGAFGNFHWRENFDTIVRVNAGYITNTGHEKEAPLVEAEIEPLWQSKQVPSLGLGFYAVPDWAKKPDWSADTIKTIRKSYFGYTARLRGRGIWDNLIRDEDGKEGPEVLRAGWTADLHMEPFVLEKLSAFVTWTYLGRISGQVPEDQYVEAGMGWTLFEPEGGDSKVSAEVKYMWGAKNYFGTPVKDQFTFTLSVLF